MAPALGTRLPLSLAFLIPMGPATTNEWLEMAGANPHEPRTAPDCNAITDGRKGFKEEEEEVEEEEEEEEGQRGRRRGEAAAEEEVGEEVVEEGRG